MFLEQFFGCLICFFPFKTALFYKNVDQITTIISIEIELTSPIVCVLSNNFSREKLG